MVNENTMYGTLGENRRTWYVKCILHLICEYAKELYIKLTEILLMKGEGNGHILRSFYTYFQNVLYILSEEFIHILRWFCTNFKMRRNYTYSKKVLYIFSISQKDLRRCEGSLKDLYTPDYIVVLKKDSLGCHNFDSPFR